MLGESPEAAAGGIKEGGGSAKARVGVKKAKVRLPIILMCTCMAHDRELLTRGMLPTCHSAPVRRVACCLPVH